VESGHVYYAPSIILGMLYDSKNILQDKNHYSKFGPRESTDFLSLSYDSVIEDNHSHAIWTSKRKFIFTFYEDNKSL